jgi:hypothetical protein
MDYKDECNMYEEMILNSKDMDKMRRNIKLLRSFIETNYIDYIKDLCNGDLSNLSSDPAAVKEMEEFIKSPEVSEFLSKLSIKDKINFEDEVSSIFAKKFYIEKKFPDIDGDLKLCGIFGIPYTHVTNNYCNSKKEEVE